MILGDESFTKHKNRVKKVRTFFEILAVLAALVSLYLLFFHVKTYHPFKESDVSHTTDTGFIALSYFELMAASLGLGTVWCGYARWALQSVVPELGRRLGIRSDHRSMYAVMFGWPAVRYARAVQREVQGLHRVRPADLEGGL